MALLGGHEKLKPHVAAEDVKRNHAARRLPAFSRQSSSFAVLWISNFLLHSRPTGVIRRLDGHRRHRHAPHRRRHVLRHHRRHALRLAARHQHEMRPVSLLRRGLCHRVLPEHYCGIRHRRRELPRHRYCDRLRGQVRRGSFHRLHNRSGARPSRDYSPSPPRVPCPGRCRYRSSRGRNNP